jgi:sensor histidine kinase YesM
MSSRGPAAVIARLAAWIIGSSLAGAVIGLTVGFFNEGGVESPIVAMSVLFGNVVGLTAMIAATFLFSRVQMLPAPLRALLLALTLVAGSVVGTLAVISSYPLFVARDPRQIVAIVAINSVLALIVGGIVYGYERMRLRLEATLREVEEVRLVQAELREEAARAQLAALQARINPHFFFNTLNTITSLLEEDPGEAEEVVHRLADLFRYTFKVADAGPVPLREELEFTRGYLAIERARFDERLRVDWELDPAALDVPVPGLILQPLVENAVGHGLAPRAEGGTVRVRASLNASVLHLEVSDDGVGLPDAPDGWVREGHGLGNVARRLEAFYRGQARFEVTPNPDRRGARVTLTIPTAALATHLTGTPGDEPAREETE